MITTANASTFTQQSTTTLVAAQPRQDLGVPLIWLGALSLCAAFWAAVTLAVVAV